MRIPTSASIDETYSVTLLTSVDLRSTLPVSFTLRHDTNSAEDFLETVRYWIDAGDLRTGDILIVDNAQVHLAAEILEELTKELNQAEITMRTLPTYSPELNPCELVFGLMKTHLRNWREEERFWLEILFAASQVTYRQVLSFYSRCISQ